MTTMASPSLLGIGLYTLAEAARLLKASPRTIRRWMRGYDYRRDGTSHHVAPLWRADLPEIDGELQLSFRDLIELRFVRAFTSIGLDVRAVRNCLDYARECTGSDRPFSTGRFRTDGQTIFLDSLDHSNQTELLNLRSKQYEFRKVVEQTFKDLDLEGDIVSRWRPFRGKKSIVIDPRRSFGQPIAAASGVPVIVLAEAVRAEGSVERVAAIYEVQRSVVQDAARFQEELVAA